MQKNRLLTRAARKAPVELQFLSGPADSYLRKMTLHRFRPISAVVLLLLCSVVPAFTEQPSRSRLLYGALVFVASSQGSNMGAQLTSEMAKHKVPVAISTERPYADYILAGYAEPKSGGIWQAQAVLADAHTRAIAWTAEFAGQCKPCEAAPEKAEQIMAARFVKKLKHDLFSGESLSERIDDFLAP